MNEPVSFELDSVPRGIKKLETGIYDYTTAVEPSAGIRQRFLISNRPLYRIRLVVIRRTESEPIPSVGELVSHPFAVLSGNDFHYLDPFKVTLRNTPNRYDVLSVNRGIELVQGKRLDYFLTYYDEALPLSEPLIYDLLVEKPVYVVVSRLHPAANALLKHVNDALSMEQVE